MNEHDDARMQRYLDGEMDARERAHFERELLESEETCGEAYDELAVREALARRIAGSGGRTLRRVPWPRRPWVTTFAAAAAIVALVAILRPVAPPLEVLRSGRSGGPRALAPAGPQDAPPLRFVWSRGVETERYRFELFDGSGTRVHVRVLRDTLVSFASADSVPLVGAWRTTALDDLGLDLRSTGRVEYEVRR